MRVTKLARVATAPGDYVPYRWMLHRVAEHGCASRRTIARVLTHSEAPPPWIAYQSLASMVVPDKVITLDVIEATARAAAEEARNRRSIAAGRAPSPAAQQSTNEPTSSSPDTNQVFLANSVTARDGMKIVARIANGLPNLIAEPEVANALCTALAVAQLHREAVQQFMRIPTHHVTRRLWSTMIRLACAGAVHDLDALKRLVAIDTFPLAWTLEGADAASIIVNTFALPANTAYLVLLRHLVPTILHERGLPVPMMSKALAVPPPETAHAVREIRQWDAELRGEAIPDPFQSPESKKSGYRQRSAARLAESVTSRMSQAQLLAALNEHYQREGTQPANAAAVNAVARADVLAFRAFFDVTRHRFAGSGDLALNWRVPWRLLQMLNRTNPTWVETAHPDDARHVADLIIATIARSSNPWHALNFANYVSQKGLVDGVEAALTVLHQAHRGQFAEQAAAASKLIFQWLVGPAAIHLNPSRRHQIIPACRVLMKLEMFEELEQLYDLAVQHSAGSDAGIAWLGSKISEVMHDILCPACGSVLHSTDVTADRHCHSCGFLVEKKELALATSGVVNEHKMQMLEQNRQRRVAARQNIRSRIQESRAPPMSAARASSSAKGASTASAAVRQPRNLTTKDSTALFREQLLSSDVDAALQPSVQTPWHQDPLAPMSAAPSAAPPGSSLTTSGDIAVPRRITNINPHAAELSLNVVPKPSARRPWTCCWCSSKNSATSDSIECSSCGATTGPAAGWRRFRGGAGNDIIRELRFRIDTLIADNAAASRSGGNSADGGRKSRGLAEEALTIGYLALLYRRAIFLRARNAAGDYVHLDMLVALLCHFQERVLAAYIYFNLIPTGLRIVNDTMRALVTIFDRRKKVSDEELSGLLSVADAEKLKVAIVGPDTCGLCFGVHAVRDCPIRTRQFTAKTGPGAKKNQKSAASGPSDAAEVLQLISAIRPDLPETLYPAYAGFLALEDREALAREHSPEVNYLSIMLMKFFFMRRAAMVLCHIPYHLRSTEALMNVCRGFGVETEDALLMLANRKYGDATATQPNFVQLTKTCCMCFHDNHASHACPILQYWFYSALKACDSPLAESYAFELPQGEEYQLGGRGQRFSQWSPLAVRTWATTGPERLQAFSKFLISRVDAVSNAGRTSDDLKLAVNMCATKLAATGIHHQAFRHYAWTPVEMLHKTTTATLLRARGFSDAIVSQGLQGDAGSDWHLMALPADACLLCFKTGHGFYNCTELRFLEPAQKWQQIANLVSSFRVSNVGVLAAAQALLYDYAAGALTLKVVREHRDLRESIIRLARRCFGSKLPRQGAALLRLLPFEDLTVSLHIELWRAAGKSEEAIQADLKPLETALHSLHELSAAPRLALAASNLDHQQQQQVVPSVGGVKMYQVQAEYRRAARASVCTRCMGAGHDSVNCPVHLEEVDFGRDLIASFRIPVADEPNFEPLVTYGIVMELARFVAKHHRQIPWHIASVTRAANGIATMLALMDNVPAALRLLLYIPPCYRGEHVFYHILCRFDVETAEVERLLEQVFPAQRNPDGSVTRQGLDLETTSSVLRLHPIPDRAVEQVFSRIPNVEDVIKAGEHQLAATDVTDPTQPTTVDLCQWATMEELNEALLPIVEKVEKITGVAIGSRIISADSVEELPPLPLSLGEESDNAPLKD